MVLLVVDHTDHSMIGWMVIDRSRDLLVSRLLLLVNCAAFEEALDLYLASSWSS
jgi:hypothetical protein